MSATEGSFQMANVSKNNNAIAHIAYL